MRRDIVQKAFSKNITSILIYVKDIILNESAVVGVNLYDVDGWNGMDAVFTTHEWTLSGDLYNDWGLDDQYIQNFVSSQLSLTYAYRVCFSQIYM